MKKQYKLIIPEPCNENWNKMTETEQGKFCAVCSKNLIDFTDKSKLEIQEILSDRQEKICGRFNVEQLDSVHIEIPEYAFRKQYSFARIFAIALLLVMGTTLLSCNLDGKTKKIETVTVVEDSNKKLKNDDDNDGIPNEFDVDYIAKEKKNDSLIKENEEYFKKDSIKRQKEIIKRERIRKEIEESLKSLKRIKQSHRIIGLIKRIPEPNENVIPNAPLKNRLKRDIELVLFGRKQPIEVTNHFCTPNQKIVVNNKETTFPEFYKKNSGNKKHAFEKIKIKNLAIFLTEEGCVNTLSFEYRKFSTLNSINNKETNTKENTSTNKTMMIQNNDTIKKQINISKEVLPKIKDSIK